MEKGLWTSCLKERNGSKASESLDIIKTFKMLLLPICMKDAQDQ